MGDVEEYRPLESLDFVWSRQRRLTMMSNFLALQENGYAMAEAIFGPTEMRSVEETLEGVSGAGAGTRSLLELAWCQALVLQLRDALELRGMAIQCTLFDKAPGRNWLVPLHQDLSIPVRERVEHPALSAWSIKEGMQFVQAPVELLEQLIAVRIHIDDCGEDNGPLRVVPGSHRHGRLSAEESKRLRAAVGEVSCPAKRGDVLLFKPLLLHASSRSSSPRHRRVLQFLFGPTSIGYGLQWEQAA